ncbi:MAG: TonB-dependent receptor [Bacteroidales bacterium]|nr:TonB-dependent receptor [Bacteroidales bacterium]
MKIFYNTHTPIYRHLPVIVFFFLLLIQCNVVSAQKPASDHVEGVVYDQAGATIIGVSVLIEGTTRGTITDVEGKFNLEIGSAKAKLTFSFIGFISQTLEVTPGSTLKITLVEESKQLEGFVVVGYGTQRKKDLTGAVAVVDVKEMKKMQPPTIGQALQGQVSGVSVSTSGEPGSTADIRIRGVGSFSNVGPLYVVDGMILTGGHPEFNVNDVESMQVLKDASATALFGARGANGVIIITTKKGKEGKTHIELSANYGVQQIANRIDMMNSLDFLRVNRQAYENAGKTWPGEPDQGQVLVNTDWQNEFFKIGNTQDYNLTISGGNKDGNYLVSGNVFTQNGVVEGPWHNRYALRVNTGMKKGIFSFGENVLLTRSQTKPMIGLPFIDLCRMPPIIPVRYDDGSYGIGSTMYQTYGTNPVGLQETRDFIQNGNNILGNVFAEVEILKDLKFKSNLGVEYNSWNDREKTTFDQIRYLEVSNYTNQVTERRGDFTTLIFENTLTYKKAIGKHSFDALAGYTAQQTNWKQMTSTVHDLVPGFWVLSAGSKDMVMSGTDSENSMLSMLGRVNYAYDDKYLVQGNIRRDGSSRFGENYRYGIFPSASLGWRISQENFFGNAKKYINDLKLRASYGTIGDQQAIGDYDYATYITVGEGGIFGPDQVLNVGSIQKGRSNPNLRWESKTTLNLGFDFAALGSKLYGSVEYFSADSKDILVKLPVSWTDGSDITPWTNYGKVNNKGVEVSLGYREQSKAFKYNVSVNMTSLKNTVQQLGQSYREGGINGVNHSEEGRSVGDFYVVRTDGIFQNWDEIYAHSKININSTTGDTVANMIQPNAKPGDIRYKDSNNDGKIDKNDREFVGSPFPRFELGLQFSCDYKNFDLSLFITGVFGNMIYNNTKFWLERMDETSNLPANLVPWTEENHSTTTPRAMMGPNDNTLSYSDRWMEKGDYVRIKNLQIGYNIPKTILKTKVVESFRFFAGVQNLLTITKYSGYDPEISGGDIFGKGNDDGHFPPVRSFNGGIQVSF